MGIERNPCYRDRLLFLPALSVVVLTAATSAAALTDDEANTIEIVRRSAPGVVHLEARWRSLSQEEAAARQSSTGTGFVLDTQGRILTAYHVIEGMNEITVILDSGVRTAARLLGTAPQIDIAVLQIDVQAAGLHPLPLGDSRSLLVGQKVIAVGHPYGLHNTVTVGVISALARNLEGGSIELEDAYIQTDAAVNPGNSGGPLLNSSGEVVGINRLIIGGAQNLGFAVPIHLARRVIPDLIAMGHPYRPQLGFSGRPVTRSISTLFGLDAEAGLLVEEVLPRSPAGAIGLQAGDRIVVAGDQVYVVGGDIITAVNGRDLRSAGQLAQVLLNSHPGDVLRLEILRHGKKMELVLTLPEMQM